MAVKPRRLQRKRTKGWKKPAGSVYVGRPTKYGNPCQTLAGFRLWVMQPAQKWLREAAKQELRGKDLLCWCAEGAACHADIWLEIANND